MNKSKKYVIEETGMDIHLNGSIGGGLCNFIETDTFIIFIHILFLNLFMCE